MKKELFYTIILIVPMLLLLSFPAWPIPGLINYQGKLTDPNGVSLDGVYIMKFYLYNVESGGSNLWNEQQDVTVTNGIYNVELGKISLFPSDLFDNEDLFLEVEIFKTVIGWETLSPRQRLTSTPFAMKAASSNIAGDADTVDGIHAADLEESNEIDEDIAAHLAIPDAHHTKTTNFAELTDMATDEQIPDDITVNFAATAGDAEKLDGKDSSEFGDGHSLDAADSDPVDVLYVDSNGNVGIGTTNPDEKLHLHGSFVQRAMIESSSGNQAGLILKSGSNFANIQMDTAVNEKKLNFMINSSSKMTVDGNNGNVGIGTTEPEAKLHVVGNLLGAAMDTAGNPLRIVCSKTTPGATNWIQYSTSSLYVDVDTSMAGFSSTPFYFTSIGGNTHHYNTVGATSIYWAGATGFRIYLKDLDGDITPQQANIDKWHINWCAIGN